MDMQKSNRFVRATICFMLCVGLFLLTLRVCAAADELFYGVKNTCGKAKSFLPAFFFDRSSSRAGLMRYFRSTDEGPRFLFGCNEPSLTGLENLHASASEQLTEMELRGLSNSVGSSKILLIDLRAEPHAFITGRLHIHTDEFDDEVAVTGEPIGWYEADAQAKKDDYAYALEGVDVSVVKSSEFTMLQQNGSAQVFGNLKMDTISVETVKTEIELAHKYHCAYARIPIVPKAIPTDEQVDRFVQLIKSLPADMRVHFHERDGLERTTLFLIMYDVLVNAKQVSLNDIIKRQYTLGGVDFNGPEFTHYRSFLEKFHIMHR